MGPDWDLPTIKKFQVSVISYCEVNYEENLALNEVKKERNDSTL